MLTLILISYCRLAYGQVEEVRFERSYGEESAPYAEVIAFYQSLAQSSPQVRIETVGSTDFGKPLHVVLLSRDQVFDPQTIKAQGKAFLLINNGIHPGEPCGIDASMMLARDLVAGNDIPEELVIGIIPIYNIGGAHNRGSFSRANQVGPQAYGFRGNARNYDLNRDFMKMDTRNAKAFVEIFQRFLPDVFVDTHTTNGADYQAVMTLIETQHNKLQPAAEAFMTQRLTPALYQHMDSHGQIMSPYVNIFGRTPDDGFAGFLDLPRYSTGYTALFQCLSYVTEAHMLKPFAARVEATSIFLEGMIEYLDEHSMEVTAAVQLARRQASMADSEGLNWTLDTTQVEMISFKGYEAVYEPSQLTGQTRLRYDRSQPWEKEVPFLNSFSTSLVKDKPQAYLIPQAYHAVIERLEVNGIQVHRLAEDIAIEGETYYLRDVQSFSSPYEGHYYHREVRTQLDTQKLQFFAGDAVVFTGQWRDPYILHTLEPEAPDAFFRWNFFDGVLMQKEYFSSYVFEETALELLEADPSLAKAFQVKKEGDPAFAKNARAQLDFIYKRSPYYEKTHQRYPVVRWWGQEVLPLR